MHTDTMGRAGRTARNAMRSSGEMISAQPGPQTEFLRSPADICIYGGAAGGGKTVGLILEPLRHVCRVANFTAVFFRRTTPQITNPGGLWDESQNFYPRLGGIPHLGSARVALAPRRQDQVFASAVRHHGLRLAGRSDHVDLFRRADAFHGASVLLHGQPQPLDLRRQALHPRDLQPGRRQLGRRLPGVVDRPGERVARSPSGPAFCAITSASRKRSSGPIGRKS